MSNTFIAVEGQHDVEVVSALLEGMGFHKEVVVERLTHGFCDRLINRKFPHQGDLHKRVPNPMFLTDDNRWVAVQACGGDTEIIRTVREALYQLQSQPASLLAIGIVRDADDKPPQQQLDLLITQLQGRVDVPPFRLARPAAPGEIAAGSPNLGIFIIPDNTSTGTIEDLLLECGEIVYPGLLAGARGYVQNVDLSALTEEDKLLFGRFAGPKKATLACAANILKPGMSIATSIDQNRWLDDEARNLPRIKTLAEFVRRLCGIQHAGSR